MNFQMAMRTIALALTLLQGATAVQQAPAPANTQQAPPAIQAEQQAAATNKPQPQEPAFRNRTDKLSYAFGVDLARNLKWQRINLDVDLLVRALRDAMAGNKLLMTDEDVIATLKTFEQDRKHDLEHAKTMRSEKNKKAGETFVAENVKKEGVVTLPSGLQYKILKQGDGKKPTINDKVVCHYRGTLLDGTEFDSSYKRNEPVTLPVKGLIKGWSEAVQLMPLGSKWQLFVPPHLAYGERVVGGIGPNAMLVFEVELISIKNSAGEDATASHMGDSANARDDAKQKVSASRVDQEKVDTAKAESRAEEKAAGYKAVPAAITQ
jgi:FKBP-type peptidyl-prolyl cis-trans isomerase